MSAHAAPAPRRKSAGWRSELADSRACQMAELLATGKHTVNSTAAVIGISTSTAKQIADRCGLRTPASVDRTSHLSEAGRKGAESNPRTVAARAQRARLIETAKEVFAAGGTLLDAAAKAGVGRNQMVRACQIAGIAASPEAVRRAIEAKRKAAFEASLAKAGSLRVVRDAKILEALRAGHMDKTIMRDLRVAKAAIQGVRKAALAAGDLVGWKRHRSPPPVPAAKPKPEKVSRAAPPKERKPVYLVGFAAPAHRAHHYHSADFKARSAEQQAIQARAQAHATRTSMAPPMSEAEAQRLIAEAVAAGKVTRCPPRAVEAINQGLGLAASAGAGT